MLLSDRDTSSVISVFRVLMRRLFGLVLRSSFRVLKFSRIDAGRVVNLLTTSLYAVLHLS